MNLLDAIMLTLLLIVAASFLALFLIALILGSCEVCRQLFDAFKELRVLWQTKPRNHSSDGRE